MFDLLCAESSGHVPASSLLQVAVYNTHGMTCPMKDRHGIVGIPSSVAICSCTFVS
jgi:hypothetical protein